MEEYEILREKYGLPGLKAMDREFEISTIEIDTFFIRNIRKKMTEKVEYFADMLLKVLQPETDISQLHEVSFFSDAEKDELLHTYKKLMYHFKWAVRLVVDDSDKENAEFINETYKMLQDIKPKLKKYCDKIRDTWTKELRTKDKAGYFG